MATNDWKAELKRRIQSIRDKKQQDSDDRGEAPPFQRSSVAPVPKPVEENLSVGIDEDAETENSSDVTHIPVPSKDDHYSEKPNADRRTKRTTTSSDIPESSSSLRKSGLPKTDPGGTKGIQEDPTEEEELTLFPVEQLAIKVDDEAHESKAERSHSNTSSSSKGTTAAPFGSEAEELTDSYVPLDSYSAQNDSREKEYQVGRESYHPDRRQRRTNILRVAAATTDLVILVASEAAIIWIAGLLAEMNPLDLLMNSIWSFGWLFMAMHFVYYVLFTSTTGQTPGKSAFGLKVVRERPGTIGIGKGIARWLFMLLSLAPLAFGYIFLFFNRNGRSLYDLALGHQIRRVDR